MTSQSKNKIKALKYSAFFSLALAGLVPHEAFAMADTTWLQSPASNDMSDSTNYSPSQPFQQNVHYGASNTTNLTMASDFSVTGFVLDPGAPQYTFANPGQTLEITGAPAINYNGEVDAQQASPGFSNQSNFQAQFTVDQAGTDLFGNQSTSTSTLQSIVNLGNSVITASNGSTVHFTAFSDAGTSTINLNQSTLLIDGVQSVQTSPNQQIYSSVRTLAYVTDPTQTVQTFVVSNGTGDMANVVAHAGTIDITGLLDTNGNPGGAFTTLGAISDDSADGQLKMGANSLAVGALNTDTVYNGVISGAGGTFIKIGTGSLTLNGVNTFTGETDINGGTLLVGDETHPNASIAGPVSVDLSGVLRGHGMVGTLGNAGMVRPGGSIGTLSVNGNYTQAPSGVLAIDLNPTVADLLNVSGRANLGGALVVMPEAGTYTTGKVYKIVAAGTGVNGTFTTVSNTSPGVTVTELYLPNEVDLVIDGTTTGPLVPGGVAGTIFALPTVEAVAPPPPRVSTAGLTQNETLIANKINSILPGATGGFGSLLNGLAGSVTALQPAALRGLSGELRVDLPTMDLTNLTSFQNFLIDRMAFRQGMSSTTSASNGLPGTFDVAMADTDGMPLFGSNNGVVPLDQPLVWMKGYGVFSSAGGQAGVLGYDANTGGIVAGIDAKPTPDAVVGIALGYENTSLNDTVLGDQTGNIDTYRVTIYGSQHFEPVTFDAALGYAFNSYHNEEFVPLPGSPYVSTSNHIGNELTAEVGASHTFDVVQDLVDGALKLTPRLGISYDNISESRYTTMGAPTPGLNLDANGVALNALRTTLGGRANLKLTTAGGTVIEPEISANWLHDYMDTNQPLTQAFTGAETAGFTIRGIHPGRDAALLGAGLNVGFSQNVTGSVGYGAAIRDHETDHTILVGIKVKW